MRFYSVSWFVDWQKRKSTSFLEKERPKLNLQFIKEYFAADSRRKAQIGQIVPANESK